VVSYGTTRDGQLDYDQILQLAQQHHPKVIVAGYTSYPWAPDFERFREIADQVRAYLMADVAHTAGMVIGGQYPNPVGVADVTTFTTHKTLCGPRGACILTTHRSLARKIDRAVFPGMQGGPHTNKFAAMCVAFEIARTAPFRELQQHIVENAQALARGLVDRGLGLAYGGTNTHLLLLDLKSVSSDGAPLYGEVVARILELAGIVVNKNTIPGDTVTALATGIRMGTPWVSQRGMGPVEMDTLAECVERIVRGIVPFTYEARRGPLPRGKIDLEVLEEVKWVIDGLARGAKAEIQEGESAYPHYCLQRRQVELPTPLFNAETTWELDDGGVSLIDMSDVGVLWISGWRARPFLDDLCTADVACLEPRQGMRSLLLDREGRVVDDVTVWRLDVDERGRDEYLVFTNPENVEHTVAWMRGLSDGYVLFDDTDVWRKVRGPAKVEVLSEPDDDQRVAVIAVRGHDASAWVRRVLGVELPERRDVWHCIPVQRDEAVLWVGHGGYGESDDQIDIVGPPSALRKVWESLEEAGARPTAAPATRHHLRQSAGLPVCWPIGSDAEHIVRDAAPYVERLPSLFSLGKPYFVGQDRLPGPRNVPPRGAFVWAEPTGTPLKRTPLYQEHQGLGARLISFAGWEMPVWYSSVGEEHRAVRQAAGLFDVAHMGTIEVSGPHAVDLLDMVTVNYVWWLEDGASQYSGLLDADGHILDDVIVYRRAWDRYLVVVNAANFDKDWAWLNAVNRDEVLLDVERPWVRTLCPAVLSDLKDPSSGDRQLVDIALQGPRSLEILLSCVDDPGLAFRLRGLERARFLEASLAGMDVLISCTGYTGESIGFELYVHPDRAVELWRLLLERGAPMGVKPCGLAARDSARIEAGLPLYGHELGGSLEITQTEAGFGSYVKYHKPFFVGRTPYKAYNDQSTRQIVRFGVTERGARTIRGGEHGEPVVNRRGRVIGIVTSCALVGDRQIGMALIEARYAAPGTELLIYPDSRKAVSKPPREFALGDTVAMPVKAEVLPRFPRG